eukprot:m.249992 g.249992  ORF g.249992 m.249992 type:complete len:403 (+) comp16476_c0_seq1:44-1252(+)
MSLGLRAANNPQQCESSKVLLAGEDKMRPNFTCSLLEEFTAIAGKMGITVAAASTPDTVCLLLPAPTLSPYSGATFQVDVTRVDNELVWRWASAIYHPTLAPGRSLCTSCILLDDLHTRKTPSEVLRDIFSLLSFPHHARTCAHCTGDPAALAEVQTDPSFFLRKARVRTPGANPPSDEELRTPCSLDFGQLLTTGMFSDVKMLVDKTVFRCHRTVLAARSPVLARIFSAGDGGIVRVRETASPTTFARLLQFAYSSKLHSALPLEDHFDMYQLAYKYRVTPLTNFHMSCVARHVTPENASSLLERAIAVGEPNLPLAIARYIETLSQPASASCSRPASPDDPTPVDTTLDPDATPGRLDPALCRRVKTHFRLSSPSESRAASPTGPTRRHASHETHRHAPY